MASSRAPKAARTALAAAAVLALSVLVGRELVSTSPLSSGGEAVSASAPRLLGHTNLGTAIRFSLLLRSGDESELSRFLREVHDPRAPGYRDYVNAEEYGARFGIPLAVIGRARQWLRGAGFRPQLRRPSEYRYGRAVARRSLAASSECGLRTSSTHRGSATTPR